MRSDGHKHHTHAQLLIIRLVGIGQEDRRVPKCHWGSTFELEMIGAMVAHSVLQGGPGLPSLHPAVYRTMVNGEAQAITALTENELPTLNG